MEEPAWVEPCRQKDLVGMKRTITRDNVNQVWGRSCTPLVMSIGYYHAAGMRWLIYEMGASLDFALNQVTLVLHNPDVTSVLCAAGMHPDYISQTQHSNDWTHLVKVVDHYDTCWRFKILPHKYPAYQTVIRILIAYGASDRRINFEWYVPSTQQFVRRCVAARARCLAVARAVLFVGKCTAGRELRDVCGMMARMLWHSRLLAEWEVDPMATL